MICNLKVVGSNPSSGSKYQVKSIVVRLLDTLNTGCWLVPSVVKSDAKAAIVPYRDVVQLVERMVWDHDVEGSSPFIPTIPYPTGTISS